MKADSNGPLRGRRITRPAPGESWATYWPEDANHPTSSHCEPEARSHYWLGRQARFPSSYTGKCGWSAPPKRKAANDNLPVRTGGLFVVGSDGPSCDWLAKRNSAGCAGATRLKGTRIERNLASTEPSAHRILLQAGELLRPPLLAANDNELLADEDGGSGVDRRHDIRPSVDDLISAYYDGTKLRTVYRKDGRVLHLPASPPSYHSDKGGRCFPQDWS